MVYTFIIKPLKRNDSYLNENIYKLYIQVCIKYMSYNNNVKFIEIMRTTFVCEYNINKTLI